MRWIVKHGDIVDEPADVLICSANVFLNLSGGVGGEILLRYGDSMQKELHKYLSDRNLRFVQRGEVVKSHPHGTHFKAVLHAVAVDGFYHSSSEIVENVVRKSLALAADSGARTVALTALATGYGKLTMKQFAIGVRPLLATDFRPIERITVCVRHPSEAAEVTKYMKRNN